MSSLFFNYLPAKAGVVTGEENGPQSTAQASPMIGSTNIVDKRHI
jgi:hypothetical protein